MPFSTGNFDKLLDKATSSNLLEPDWDATLQLCDAVRAGEVTPKYAANAVSRKVMDKNSNVCLFALSVAESCMKNCGAKFHEELLTPLFLENLHALAVKSELPIRSKICALIQAWERAFRNNAKFSFVKTCFDTMKREDFTFAESMNESDYMFVSDCAPEWKEDKQCYRCRTEFTTFVRQHHCRHCGQSFCAKCSSKVKAIPKFGIEKEVRVCDSCFDILSGKQSNNASSAGSTVNSTNNMDAPSANDDDELMAAYLKSSLAKEAQTPAPVSREEKLKEEEELQLALAISQSEAEATTSKSASSGKKSRDSSPKVRSYDSSGKAAEEPKSDELAKYMDRSYWEKKRQEQQQQHVPENDYSKTVNVNAPSRNDAMPRMESMGSVTSNQMPYMNGTANAEESNETCNLIQHKLDMFLNRMRSNMTRGRNISQDSAVQSAFQELSSLQPVLAKLIATNEMKRNHFESQQDQLSLLKDTRETLDSMRDDHQEKLRQERLEKERQMQLQRQQKMEALRGLKQQFLLHRMQQLETERQNQQASMADLQMQQQHYHYHQAPPMMPGPLPHQYGSIPQQTSPYGSLNPPAVQMHQGQAHPAVPPNMMPYQGQQQMPAAYNMQQMGAALPPASAGSIPGQVPNPAVQGQPGPYMMPGTGNVPQVQPQPGQYSSIPNQTMQGGIPGALPNQQHYMQQYQSMTAAPVGSIQNPQFMQGGMQQQQPQQMQPESAGVQPAPPQSVPQNVATESPLIDFG